MPSLPTWRPIRAVAGGAIGILLAIAAWEAAAGRLVPLILPSPRVVFADVAVLLGSSDGWTVIAPTGRRAMLGFAAGGAVGLAVGVAAGLSRALDKVVDPILTLLMAMPPIAWVVLALIWFGITDTAAAFTTAVSAAPVLAVAARAGLVARDRGLDRMAELYGAPALVRLIDVRLPQMVTHVTPAAITALAIAVKVTVMVELLALADGLGAALARARVDLESTRAFAWIVVTLALVYGADRGVLRPLHRRFERWRDAGLAPPLAGGGG